MVRPLYKLRIPDTVAELLRNLHPHLKKKVKQSLQIILTEPNAGKALKDELVGLRSFKVGRFRIIYRISDGREIEVIAVGPRARIYEDTLRLVKKKEKE